MNMLCCCSRWSSLPEGLAASPSAALSRRPIARPHEREKRMLGGIRRKDEAASGEAVSRRLNPNRPRRFGRNYSSVE
jgi:hypothetical protein